MTSKLLRYTFAALVVASVLVSCVVIGGVVAKVGMKDPPKVAALPRYHQHECFQQTEYEPWQEHTIWKVEQVGKSHYLARPTPVNLYRAVEGLTLPFSIDLVSESVQCPT